MRQPPLVITISRQRGCGGAYLGQRIATTLGIRYLDRELVAETANRLETSEEFVEAYDERIVPIWDSLIEPLSVASIYSNNPPPLRWPADKVRELESEIIVKIASEVSAVIVGRGGCHLLRNHPRHAAILLYANTAWRERRIQDIYGMSPKEAAKSIAQTDTARIRFRKAQSGHDPSDPSLYHICLDTGVLGLDNAEAVLLHYIRTRFGLRPGETA